MRVKQSPNLSARMTISLLTRDRIWWKCLKTNCSICFDIFCSLKQLQPHILKVIQSIHARSLEKTLKTNPIKRDLWKLAHLAQNVKVATKNIPRLYDFWCTLLSFLKRIELAALVNFGSPWNEFLIVDFSISSLPTMVAECWLATKSKVLKLETYPSRLKLSIKV